MYDPNLEAQIKVSAYFISTKGYSYNELCWMLAEKQLKLESDGKTDDQQIQKRAKEIFNAFNSYDALCWLIAELEVLEKENLLYKRSN